ncbi:MAG: hypothetical protein IIT40_01545, partial [Prevotella sp.]|nr:hypothetical protein [Prevotella sp.]
VSCNNSSVPKPYGYFRITTPDTAYTPFSLSLGEGRGEAFLTSSPPYEYRSRRGEECWKP